MANALQVYQAVAIADPATPANVLKPQADGSLNVNATVTADIGDFGVANAAPPSFSEAEDVPASLDLAGNMRVKDAAVITALAGILAVQTSFLYNNITTATTTLVKSGAGVLRGVTINTKGTIASTTQIYDGLTAGGALIGTIDSLNLAGQFEYDIAFATGLTIVTTGTVAPDVTVSYR